MNIDHIPVQWYKGEGLHEETSHFDPQALLTVRDFVSLTKMKRKVHHTHAYGGDTVGITCILLYVVVVVYYTGVKVHMPNIPLFH